MNHEQEYSDLALVVARLTAIALKVATQSLAVSNSLQRPLAFDYRSWPTCQIVGSRDGREELLKFYVCRKGAATLHDEPFSLGTRFVMETYRVAAGNVRDGGVTGPVRHRLVRISTLQKYAGLETVSRASCAVEGWLFSTVSQPYRSATGLGRPGRALSFMSVRRASITIGAGLRGWTALTTQGVPTEGSVCPYASLSHILERQYARTA